MVIGALDELLETFKISGSDWTSAEIGWSDLHLIGLDHHARSEDLRNSAEYFAKTIQNIENIHSVRWRIKDPNHLMEKIIRKKIQKAEKYEGININNYRELITDLVGIRALHLFKSDAIKIHNKLIGIWDFVEKPVAYIRDGDGGLWLQQLIESGIQTKNHPDKYRSVHYVLQSSPKKEIVYAEVQVRTIFEEGWSEVDHIVRYPRFSEDALVKGYLDTFNRLAGSADEMADFVIGLAASVKSFHEERRQYQEQLDKSQLKVEKLIHEIEKYDQKNTKYESLVKSLKSEVSQWKGIANQANSHNINNPSHLFYNTNSNSLLQDGMPKWISSGDAISAARREAVPPILLSDHQSIGAAVPPVRSSVNPTSPSRDQNVSGAPGSKPKT